MKLVRGQKITRKQYESIDYTKQFVEVKEDGSKTLKSTLVPCGSCLTVLHTEKDDEKWATFKENYSSCKTCYNSN